MRKIILLPLNILVFLLSLIGVLVVRVKERSIWMDRKLDNFENKRKKKKTLNKR
jgi:hypothetical protein